MAFDLSSLTAYVEENRADLIMKPILGGRSLEFVDVRQGIKSGEKIPILESTAPAQAGASCGFTSSGTTTVSQTTLNTTSIVIQEAICLRDLEAYYTQKYLPAGSMPESTTIEQMIIDRKLANIARKLEQTLWQGKTTYTNDTYLKQFNGWISLIDTAGTAVAATQQAAINASTVIGIFDDIIYSKIPAQIIGSRPVVFCGMDTFRTLCLALKTANLFHFAPGANEFDGMRLTYPFTNIEVIAVPGLNNDNPVDTGTLQTAVKNRIIAGSRDNFVVGFDVQNDTENFDVWYSKDNRQLRFHLRFRVGVTNHFYDQIVQYQNT